MLKFRNDSLLTQSIYKYKKLIENNINTLNVKYKGDLGWSKPENSLCLIENINILAANIREKYDTVIICGVGGSYLGSRALIEALSKDYDSPEIIFMGNNISPLKIENILEKIKNKNVCSIVISKSGNTLDTLIVYKIIKNYLKDRYDDYKSRIYIITNNKNGYLRKECDDGYKNLSVPEDIGGRYSVLTSVGLLPAAIKGIDIKELLKGAVDYKNYLNTKDLMENDCVRYAISRYELSKRGKNIEILCSYNTDIEYFLKWYVQLFGESEGKKQGAIYPSYLQYTQDLHSMGQYIQEGSKNIFETIIEIKINSEDCYINLESIDCVKYKNLNKYSLKKINNKLLKAIKAAHRENDIEILSIELETLDEYNMGQLIYFFMYSCAISAMMFQVNPFNQPGVEKYKKIFIDLIN